MTNTIFTVNGKQYNLENLKVETVWKYHTQLEIYLDGDYVATDYGWDIDSMDYAEYIEDYNWDLVYVIPMDEDVDDLDDGFGAEWLWDKITSSTGYQLMLTRYEEIHEGED